MIYLYEENRGMRSSGIVTSVISIIFGLLISLLSAFAFDAMVEIVFTIIGVGIIVANIIPLIIAIQRLKLDNKYVVDLVFSILSIVIGAMFIFEHSAVISIVCGVFLVVIPLIRILLAPNKLLELKRQLPLFVVAILMFFNVAGAVLRIALIVIGALLAILGIVNLVIELIDNYKHRNDNPFDDGANSASDTSENKSDNVIDAEFKEL